MKLTKWYKANQKPVRIGYYECRCCNNLFYWNGKNFVSNNFSDFDTVLIKGWRGIDKAIR